MIFFFSWETTNELNPVWDGMASERKGNDKKREKEEGKKERESDETARGYEILKSLMIYNLVD